MQGIMGKRAFLTAAVLFLTAAVIPLLTGGKLKPAFFALAMAFLVIGLSRGKKNQEI
jgi:hypothetical protein